MRWIIWIVAAIGVRSRSSWSQSGTASRRHTAVTRVAKVAQPPDAGLRAAVRRRSLSDLASGGEGTRSPTRSRRPPRLDGNRQRHEYPPVLRNNGTADAAGRAHCRPVTAVWRHVDVPHRSGCQAGARSRLPRMARSTTLSSGSCRDSCSATTRRSTNSSRISRQAAGTAFSAAARRSPGWSADRSARSAGFPTPPGSPPPASRRTCGSSGPGTSRDTRTRQASPAR